MRAESGRWFGGLDPPLGLATTISESVSLRPFSSPAFLFSAGVPIFRSTEAGPLQGRFPQRRLLHKFYDGVSTPVIQCFRRCRG